MTIKSIPYRVAGIILLLYILSTVDVKGIAAQLRQLEPASVGFAALPVFGLLVFRCWRWLELVRAAGSRLDTRTLFITCNESIWLGLASPARLGEFRRAVPLSGKQELGLAPASALVVVDLAMDLYAFAVVALSGMAIHYLARNFGMPWLSQILFAAALVSSFLLLTQIRWPLRIAAHLPLIARMLPGLSVLVQKLTTGLAGAAPARISLCTAMVLTSFLTMTTILVSAIGLDLNFVQTMTMIGLVGISGAIPITYFGFGTREAVLIWYLHDFGYSAEKAIAVSGVFVIIYFLGIAVSLVFAAALHVFFRFRAA